MGWNGARTVQVGQMQGQYHPIPQPGPGYYTPTYVPPVVAVPTETTEMPTDQTNWTTIAIAAAGLAVLAAVLLRR